MEKLFGTDGVRGIANEELTCLLALRIGAAGAHVVAGGEKAPCILIGCDTRKSSPMLAAALCAGVCSVGGNVLDLGVLPTPAMAYLARAYAADAAVMVSASHNAMEFNGIKWFDGAGCKLSDATEDAIEALVRDPSPLPVPTGTKVGDISPAPEALEQYKQFLIGCSDGRLDGLTIALDCANGSASAVAPAVFRALGARVLAFSDAPDGCNINDNCGSTHPQQLARLVLEHGADAGFAFDGDADRVIAADEAGTVVDGDRIMGALALDLQRRGALRQDTLVLTVMSNLGLKRRMEVAGIRVLETAVGDRYVFEALQRDGLSLGGEQSGHVILADHNTTGDGILTAVKLLGALTAGGRRMSDLVRDIPIFPQVLRNVRVENSRKAAVMADETVLLRIAQAQAQLGERGRVLVRESGTEPLVRIMLEGEEQAHIHALALTIAEAVEWVK